jgi:hypothetical protein
MALLKDIAALKSYVPVNKNMSYDTLSPFIAQAELTYIIPVIGQDLYDDINTAYNGVYGAAGVDASLLPYIQRALAYFTVLEAAPFLTVMISDLGIQEQQSKEGTSRTVAQWTYNKIIDSLTNNADRSLDDLLKFLEDNKDDYPEWADDADLYTITKNLFINSATELSEYVNIFGSRSTFKAIRKFILLAEENYFIPAMGQEMYDELKAQLLAGTLTSANNTLLNKIKRPLANYAVWHAIPHLRLNVSSNGIRVHSFTDSQHSKQPVTDNSPLADLMQSLYNTAQSGLASFKYFLDDNVEDYPTYEDSDTYEAEFPQPDSDVRDNSDSQTFMI